MDDRRPRTDQEGRWDVGVMLGVIIFVGVGVLFAFLIGPIRGRASDRADAFRARPRSDHETRAMDEWNRYGGHL